MPIHRIQQISESHCGPAVLEMLLDAIGITRTQQEITHAAGVQYTIDEHGTRIDQLAQACAKLAPQAQFWYKYHANISDIKYILDRGYGVAVEWQGLFYNTEEEEQEEDDEDSEHGHFSIITYLDEDTEQLIMVDPYRDFANQDRIMPIDQFFRRWWDTNEITDEWTGSSQVLRDERLLFFVTPAEEEMPPELGFKKFNF